MKEYKRYRFIAIVIFIPFLVISISCLICLRIITVNNTFPASTVHSYSLGDQVTFANSSDEENELAGTTMKVIESVVLEDDELIKLIPYYEDPVITNKGASKAKILIVKILLQNDADHEEPIPLAILKAREYAWANGCDFRLFKMLNPNLTSLKLKPNESSEVFMPFSAYDTQFGFNAASWNEFGSRNIRLELTAYPNETSIDLGLPYRHQEAQTIIESKTL